MEKESITIEIKQEVSITLVWITAGVIVISAAFFLTPQSIELWPAVNAAGVAAVIYLAALLLYVLRNPIPMRSKFLVGILAVFVLSCSAFAGTRMYERSHWQADLLMKIRAVIGRGIRIAYMPQPLLKTLDAYYQQGVKKKQTLADEFRKIHPGATVGSNVYRPVGDWDKTSILVETLEPDRIVLVSQETYVPGRDPNFKNYDGKTGMVQEKFILTERGITHVSEN